MPKSCFGCGWCMGSIGRRGRRWRGWWRNGPAKVQSPRSKRKRQRGITVTGFSTTFLLFRLQRGRAGNPNSHHRGALSTTKSKSEVRRPRSEMGSRGRMGRMGESGNDRERARQAGWRREMGGWRKGGDFPCLAREAVYGGGISLVTDPGLKAEA